MPLSFTTNATDNKPNFTNTIPKFWLRGEYEIEEEVNLTNYDWYLLNMEQTGKKHKIHAQSHIGECLIIST